MTNRRINFRADLQATSSEIAASYPARADVEIPQAERVTLSSGAVVRAGIHCFNVAEDSPVGYADLTDADRREAWEAVNRRCSKFEHDRDVAQANAILAARGVIAS